MSKPFMTVSLGDLQNLEIQMPTKRGTDSSLTVKDHHGNLLAVLIMEDGKLHYYPADAQELIKHLKLVP